MAETKRATKTAPKAAMKAAEIQPSEEAAAAPEVKKTAGRRTTAKKEAVAKKEPVAKKEAAEKKEPATRKAPAKKVTEVVNFQFEGKSYTNDDLVKIAKDVWKYDHNMKAVDFKSVELYVKPEEGLAYYVINGDVTGSFVI